VDRAVAERFGQRLVDQPVLVDQRQTVEPRRRHDDLEVVTVPGPILDSKLGRIRKGAPEELLEALGCHVEHGSPAYAVCVEEIGLFPLGIVLLPSERLPLHIFEPRYRDLIGECLATDGDFGLVFADESGIRTVGTRAHVTTVIDRFEDGRLNILVEGRGRFSLVELTSGRAFQTATVKPLLDLEQKAPPESAVKLALGAFRALAELFEAGSIEIDEASPQLSFELAAHVAIGVESKQRLLELRSERERLALVAELIDEAGRSLALERELAERASRNGSRVS
jgi:Lon protease-like protein